jgi:hypothetical protein
LEHRDPGIGGREDGQERVKLVPKILQVAFIRRQGRLGRGQVDAPGAFVDLDEATPPVAQGRLVPLDLEQTFLLAHELAPAELEALG